MTFDELGDRILERSESVTSRRVISEVTTAMVDVIREELLKGEKVVIPRWATFYSRMNRGRRYWHPHFKEYRESKAHKRLKMRVCKSLEKEYGLSQNNLEIT
uniref:Putative DNA binding protein n=1 Tax=viral metagenome TaxID=1070528 RepID=A0A6M3X595_9ZZZZ